MDQGGINLYKEHAFYISFFIPAYTHVGWYIPIPIFHVLPSPGKLAAGLREGDCLTQASSVFELLESISSQRH
jgi:hypothetical protein